MSNQYTFYTNNPGLSNNAGGTSKSQDVDLEQQVILRVPPALAEQIRKFINAGTAKQRKQGLELEFEPDFRKAHLTMEGRTYDATLYDLPCNIETLKTYNKKIYYKSADIAQMLVVHEPEAPKPEKGKDYRLPSGITPPTRQIRRRRFKKISAKRREKVREVEEKLLRLMGKRDGAENEELELLEMDDEIDSTPTPPPAAAPSIIRVKPIAPAVAGAPESAAPSELKKKKKKKKKKEHKEGEPTAEGGEHKEKKKKRKKKEGAEGNGEAADRKSRKKKKDQAAPMEGIVSMAAALPMPTAALPAAIPMEVTPTTTTTTTTTTTPAAASTVAPPPPAPKVENRTYEQNPHYIQLHGQWTALQQEIDLLKANIDKKRQNAATAPNPILKARFEQQAQQLEAQLGLKSVQQAKLLEEIELIKKATS